MIPATATTATVLSVILLTLGLLGIVAVVSLVTLLAMAFIGAPDDLNDVEIDGTPKKDKDKNDKPKTRHNKR